MTPKANIPRAPMPYTRVWGHCSSRLQHIALKLHISAFRNAKTVFPEGSDQEQSLPSTPSQHASVVLGSGPRSVLLPT